MTHGPCRSAKYTPASGDGSCMPHSVPQTKFPVAHGGVMPDVPGCERLDYAVLFLAAYWG